MKVGFIGLGNVGSKLAGTLLRNRIDLCVLDLDATKVEDFVSRGARACSSPRALAETVDIVITCLPSPSACSTVMEGEDGVIQGLTEGMVWLEMSTTDASEVRRIGALVSELGASPVDCPVSGGCHRAETGNISIFAGGERQAFERALPLLRVMGRQILHTGALGTASILKVVTNYLATVNLASLAEALTVCRRLELDMNVAYEGIKASSGNSFVHETESQVILNGSRDIGFTIDLVIKDVGLFDEMARINNVLLEISPLVLDIFKDGRERYGPREHSPNIIRRLEDACGQKVRGIGFPEEITDSEPETLGDEIIIPGRQDD